MSGLFKNHIVGFLLTRLIYENLIFCRPEDAGTYTCVATNDAGRQTEEMTLTVQGRVKLIELC